MYQISAQLDHHKKQGFVLHKMNKGRFGKRKAWQIVAGPRKFLHLNTNIFSNRSILETFDSLSWLTVNPSSGRRLSCLPVHVRTLLTLKDVFEDISRWKLFWRKKNKNKSCCPLKFIISRVWSKFLLLSRGKNIRPGSAKWNSLQNNERLPPRHPL